MRIFTLKVNRNLLESAINIVITIITIIVVTTIIIIIIVVHVVMVITFSPNHL